MGAVEDKARKRRVKKKTPVETRTETRTETLEPVSETRENLETREKPETQETSEAQAIEGYACSCGFVTPDLNKFKGHQMTWARRDKENHQSLGRVNLETGEIVMPPAKDRTREQWEEAKYGKKPELSEQSSSSPSALKGAKPQQAQAMAQAMEIKFVPRVYTIDYSPIIRAAQDAAIRFWGWRPDMPLGNFLDTVIYLFYKEKGITLAGYIIEETEEERQEREAAIKNNHKVEVT